MFRALDKGLSLSATEGRHLTLSPPLVIAEHEMGQALDILEHALDEEKADSG